MSEGDIFIQELNFKNMSIIYDGNKLSKSNLAKANLIVWGGAALIVFLCCAGALFCSHLFGDSWVCYCIGTLSFVGVILGGSVIISKIVNKVSPKHLELYRWLKRFPKNGIEVGWYNDRYVIVPASPDYGHAQSIKSFLEEDYELKDEADKSKPVFATIDLTGEVPFVHITNM